MKWNACPDVLRVARAVPFPPRQEHMPWRRARLGVLARDGCRYQMTEEGAACGLSAHTLEHVRRRSVFATD
jgi:hypothetical protein